MDGDENAALADYARKVSAARTAYLHGHRVIHAQETRWPHRTFWARRHAHPGAEMPLPTAGKDQIP
jgi:hypothetical protein